MAYEYVERFSKLGLGLFIHFGLYSVLGKGEWYLSTNKISRENYEKLSEKFFVNKNWAKDLVKTAKAAGCRYITLTTRHHDGFSLYDTCGLNTFDAPHTAPKRDLIREFVDECNKGGIVPFFYHTLLDWHNPDYKNDFPKYIDYLVKSIEILCKNYGKIGGLWFDGMWDKPNENWQEDRIYGTIRKYQPEAMIINNTGLDEQGKVGHREIDSVTFERGEPSSVESDRPRAGEVCQGITDHWGYCKDDICVKCATELIGAFVDCRKNNCNFLLNTGLKGNGTINLAEKCALLSIGKWLKANKNFLFNCKPAKIEAENAMVFTDGKHYYAVIKNVPMCFNSNVTKMIGVKDIVIKTEKKIVGAKWLDNGQGVNFKSNGTFVSWPFDYGTSLGLRVAKFNLK